MRYSPSLFPHSLAALLLLKGMIRNLRLILLSAIQTSPLFSRSHKMASNRRLKVYGLLIVMAVITILFYTSRSRADPDFYSRTVSALDKKPGTPGAKDAVVGTGGQGKVSAGDEESKARQQRLKEAADTARENANAKAPKPDPPSVVVGVGSAAEGASGDRGVGGRRKHAGSDSQKPVEETAEEHDAEVELGAILKKAPSK